MGPKGMHPGDGWAAPPPTELGKRAVHILLECFLVSWLVVPFISKLVSPCHKKWRNSSIICTKLQGPFL